jgi:hypothetical protein
MKKKLIFAGILAALALVPALAYAAADAPTECCPCGCC